MSTVAKTATDVVSVLNNLIETCKDGEDGFREAAGKAKASSLQSLFTKYSAQRAQYRTELQQLVASLGEKPETSGHVAASLHRGWINLKNAFAKDEDKALIDECEAGEDAAIKNYKEALSSALPAEVSDLIRTQFTGVQEAHGVIRDLKHGVLSPTAL
jgi:uncharacterized protein (TIGR02284 family)